MVSGSDAAFGANPLAVVAETVAAEPMGADATDAAAQAFDPFCRWCGKPAGECDQVSCARELDPPRTCPTCGRRLRVVVIPTGYSASCRDHGVLNPT